VSTYLRMDQGSVGGFISNGSGDSLFHSTVLERPEDGSHSSWGPDGASSQTSDEQSSYLLGTSCSPTTTTCHPVQSQDTLLSPHQLLSPLDMNFLKSNHQQLITHSKDTPIPPAKDLLTCSKDPSTSSSTAGVLLKDKRCVKGTDLPGERKRSFTDVSKSHAASMS